ncbi:uncharacterized protein LOC143365235 [Halictus rubicundus]|uniref:uncharacterized protein LOC143365235 n=1 Tax=Halictus rubicundus TaxID=77578 RepID=UPI004036D3AC
MAEDCIDADSIEAYNRFFMEFINKVDPNDQLPVTVSSYNVTDAEIVGEIINVTLQYLNQMQCPPNLQAHLLHQVIQEIKYMCKKQPEDCGYKAQEKTYTSLKLMQAITGKVYKICYHFLINTKLPILPPPPSTPLPHVVAGGNKNFRRKMEDRYVVLHDLHATFGIEDDSVANYYAVFDGHAGQDAAVYCASHLHQYLAESRHYPTDPERALHDAFITTDTQFIEKSKTQKVCGGTTAVCTLLLNKKLYVAWVGDSSAMLVKSNTVVQLVNPHRLNREDEVQRIQRVGGVVIQSVGILRVNGVLSVSRAIGDVRYKPFVTGEPEVKCYSLDGTEDFLVIATDGLTDYVKPAEIVTVLYHEMQRSPNGLERAHHILLQWAKHAGSRDNVTLVVVLLSTASEIAARSRKTRLYNRFYSARVHDILEKMNSKDKPLFLDIDDAHNAINSNNLKQTMLSQEPRDHGDEGILAASNGKHENGDADYDYTDLGPETDVDAIDEMPMLPVKKLSYEFYKDDDSNPDEDHRDKDSNVLDNVGINAPEINPKYQPDAENNLHEDQDEDEDEDEDDEDDDKVLDEFTAPQVVQKVTPELIHEDNFAILHDVVREQIEESVDDEEMPMKNDGDRADDGQDNVDEAGPPVDYDDSPPSPQPNKPLQHALIPEADNVADSEDSEDEWNYYRVDPNKEKESTTPVNEPQQAKQEEKIESSEVPIEDNDLKIHSEDLSEEIKWKEESSELINTEISAEEKKEEQQEESIADEKDKLKDMDFQLNPDAAEFVPVSPQFAGARINLMEDYPISGSPLKQVPQMDDIQVPSQSEFDEEICQRPREVEPEEKEYQNGVHLQCNDNTDFITERQKIIGFSGNMDDSEVSSTKAEFGDVSSASFLTTSEFHRTGISTVDESFSSFERDYDIAKDPMAMSFTPSDFEAAFDKGADFDGDYKKGVDLNAVHNLSNTDLDDKNGSMEEQGLTAQSPELHPELTNLASPETEQPSHTQAFPEEPAELVNLSSQQEDSVFTEHADKPKSPFDLLNMQSESSQPEQQEAVRSEHSPLTENYSAESEKEPVSVENEQPLSPSTVDNEQLLSPSTVDNEQLLSPSTVDNEQPLSPSIVDNEQPLSPSTIDIEQPLSPSTVNIEQPLSPSTVDNEQPLSPSTIDIEQPLSPSTVDIEQPLSPSTVDIDETKPTDEASKDALLSENELQKETDAKEADTPSSLSPEPIAMESDLVAPVESDTIPSAPPVATEEFNAVVFTPPLYERQPSSIESGSIGQPEAVESEILCQSPVPESHEVCESLVATSDDIRSASSTEALDVCPSAPTSQQIIDSFEPSATTAQYEVSELSPAEANDARESPLPTTDDICQSPVEKAGDVLSASSTEALDVSPGTQQVVDPFETSSLPTYELRTSSPMVQRDVCRELSSMMNNDVCESSSVKENDFSEPPNVEECEPIVQILGVQSAEEKRAESPQPTQENLLDFAEEQEVCMKKEVEDQSTLDLSSQNVEEKIASPVDDMICHMKPAFEQETEIVPEPKETLLELEVVETKPQEVEEPVKEPALSLSESMQEFTGLECQLQPKTDDVPVSSPIPEIQEEVLKKEEAPEVKEAVEPEKPVEPAVEVVCKLQQVEQVEAVLSEVKESEPEKLPEVPETKTSEMAVATAAAAAVAASAAGAVAATQSKAKVKASPKLSSKTAVPKTAQKSNPTSPSKSVTSTTRASVGAAKKPATAATARPKDLDAPKKTASSIATSNKVAAAKPASKTTTTTATTKSATKLSANATAKPKPATTASKPAPIEKKQPTANGDVKPLSKPAAAAKTSTTTKAAPTARSATAKTTTTKTSTLTTTTKTRPVSATTAAKPSPTAKSSAATTTTTTSISRPKSVPTTGIAAKPRLPSGKPPIIDKQVKETANKQISMARTTAKTTRLSTASSTTTTATKRVSSTTKTTTAASPIKKVTAVSKVSSRVTAVAKTTTEKAKVLQNGVSEKIEMNAIIDDVPKKDLSPVVTPNDNQLIMSSD